MVGTKQSVLRLDSLLQLQHSIQTLGLRNDVLHRTSNFTDRIYRNKTKRTSENKKIEFIEPTLKIHQVI